MYSFMQTSSRTPSVAAADATPDSAAAGAERRRRRRLPAKTGGWVFLGDDDHARAREIVILNVARLGRGFEVALALEVGRIYRIRVGFGPKRLARRTKVASCTDNGRGGFLVGGEFIGSE